MKAKLVRESLNESVSSSVVNPIIMHLAGISDKDIQKVMHIVDTIAQRVGDSGSCVLGSGLKLNGRVFIEPYSQGSLGPEEIYHEVKKYLNYKYPHIKFDIEYGNMD